MPAESPTLGLGHLQFEALLTTARLSTNLNDFALVALLGLLGLRIFEACGASIADLGEEHGHRVLRVRGKGGKVVLVPLPPAVARAIDRAVDDRTSGPILRNTLGVRMDRHAATRRLKHLARATGVRMPRMHPHMLRHTFVTTMLDAGVSLRDVQIAARHADPRTTMRYDRGPQEPRPAPQLHPGRVHGLRDIASRSRLCRDECVDAGSTLDLERASGDKVDAMAEATQSPLVLGAMMFGTRIDETTAFALLDRFVERGGVWIDTADCYSFWASDTGLGGDSERVLGRWLAARPGIRDRVRISTKLGAEPVEPGSWPDRREGLSASAVRAAFAGSLDRLGIDRVDLLWLHQEDRSVPIEETVGALAGLAADRFGISNHPAWLVERGRAHAQAIGAPPFDALQLSATYLRPRPGTLPPGVVHRFGVLSDEQADYAAEHAVDLWAYTPLLSGAYDNPAKPIPEVYDHPGNKARLAALDAVAAEVGAARGQVVLAWLLSRGVRPMLGGSKLDQLDSAFDGVGLKLATEHLQRLNAAEQSSWASPYAKR